MKNNRQLHSWKAFLSALLARFGPSDYRDLKGELSKLAQNSSAHDSHSRFENLSNQLTGIDLDFLRSCFESGLRHDIRHEVRLHRPTTLLQTFSLAKMIEDKLLDTSSLYPKPRLFPQIQKTSPFLLPTPLHTLKTNNTNPHNPIPFRRLTPV